MARGKPKTIYFSPILVTATDTGPGAIQLRDVILEANGFAKVLEVCTLKDTLASKLRPTEDSDDSQQMNAHIYKFIRGLLGKGDMYLFGCGTLFFLKNRKRAPIFSHHLN
jgi:hypothetical protein